MRANNELIYTGNSTIGSNSNACLSDGWIRASFQADCTSGVLAGTFSVQVSNDLAIGQFPNQFTPTFWNTVSSSQTIASVTVGQSVLIPYFETCYRYHRVNFVSAGATGSFSVRVESKNF